MSADVRHLIDLVALTLAYWLVDHAIRGERVVAGLRRMGLSGSGLSGSSLSGAGVPRVGLSHVAALATASLALLALAWWVPWSVVPQRDAVRLMAAGISTFLMWKAATKDIDIVVGESYRYERIALVFAALGTWFSPVFVPVAALLLTTPFGLWEHHSTLPMRVLQTLVAHLCLVFGVEGWNRALRLGLFGSAGFDSAGFDSAGFGSGSLDAGPAEAAMSVASFDGVALFFFVITIQIAHYLITALAKGWLGGRRWYSWPLENRLHHLAASAYSWGWARFVPWSTWRRVIGVVKAIEKPMQMSAFGIELLAPLALFDARLAIAFCLGWSGFHLGVFLLSGLLFWDWILTNLAVAAGIWLLPTPIAGQLFGGGAVLASLIFLVVFPLRHKLYKPMPLGWWDTPFTQRIHWIGHTQSGNRYGIYNAFMCPHERLYGKVHGCFLAPTPVMTYHLGEVWKRELRDALRDAGPDSERLDAVREQFGVQPRDASMTERHIAYLRRFFVRVNRGVSKSPLPVWARWLKAPGDQVYYWGELPSYQGQEPLERVELRYREEYFDGDELVRLRDEQVLEVAIDEAADALAICAPEPTPKEIDDLLLSHGKGRLIDLPSFGDGYVKGDDGRRKGPDPEPA